MQMLFGQRWSGLLAIATILTAGTGTFPAIAGEATHEAMSQVTSVSQLSDVQPADWAFQALQSLVERYGCIVGYPNQTYRGNQAMTRYEFAAGLNACMNKMQDLIASGTADLVKKEDLEKVIRLQNQFSRELDRLQGRADRLQDRVDTLEKQQFSTTTKLGGEVIGYLANALGKTASDANNTTLSYRTRLELRTSFTGQDLLSTRLQAINIRKFDTAAAFGTSPIGRASSDISDETRLLSSPMDQSGEVRLERLQYRFPVGDKLTVFVDANSVDPTYVTDAISPFIDQATGSLSNFGNANPIFFPIGNQAGLGINYSLTPWLRLDAGYQGEIGSPNDPQLGVFSGGYSAFAQLVFQTERLKAGLLYVNSYSPQYGVDTLAGSNAAKVIGAGPVVGNGYGFQANYRVSDGFELGGWVGYNAARSLGGGTKGDAKIWNFAVTMAFPDLLVPGNLGGIIFGMQPKLTDTSNDSMAAAIGLPDGRRRDRDTGFHVEAFYRLNISDHISVTPGLIWLTAPNHDNRNPDVIMGVIRTTFLF